MKRVISVVFLLLYSFIHSSEKPKESTYLLEQSHVITIKEDPILQNISPDVLHIIFSYIDNPLSWQAQMFLRMMELNEPEIACIVGRMRTFFESFIRQRPCRNNEAIKKRVCSFLSKLPFIDRTMSESKKCQIMMMRKNADKICAALHKCIYQEFSEKNSDTTLACLDDLFLLCTIEGTTSTTPEMFLRQKKHSLQQALALSYAAALYRNDYDLAKTLPEHVKQLLPDAFGYRLQKSHKICRSIGCDAAKACSIATCFGIVFLAGFYLWYVIACFDGYHIHWGNDVGIGCFWFNSVNEDCTVFEKIAYDPEVEKEALFLGSGTCQIPESGFGLYCKKNT